MPTIDEVRQKYPQYKDLSDEQLAHGLHDKYYADMPYDDFAGKIGLKAAEQPKSAVQKLVDWTKGAGDAALAVGTGMIADPINEATEGVRLALDMPKGEAPIGQWSPKTPEGKAIVNYGANLVNATGLPSLINWGTDTNNPDPRVQATGHLINAGMGLIPFAGTAKRLASLERVAAAPTREAVKAASQSAYKAAEGTGEIMPQGALAQQFVPQIEGKLASEGFDKDLHPKTAAALNRIYDDATRPGIAGFSPKGAETIRRVLSNAENEAMASSMPGRVSSDARLAGKLVDEFDDFMEQNMPATTAAGAAARELWSRNLKAQDIENVLERAKNQAGQYSVSGEENALRSQFKTLADNPRRFNRFSATEKQAILQVARGGPVQHALRYLGKFAPTGVVPFLAAVAANGIAPGAGFALGAGGLAARAGATAMRKAAARRAYEEVLRGAPAKTLFQRIPPRTTIEQVGYPADAALENTDEVNRQRGRR